MFARIAQLLCAALCFNSPQLANAEGRSIIVLDASGSMWGQIEGRTKLEIAREALAGVLAELPADSEMGLMAYGHRTKGDCGDIELIVPPGPGTGAAIAAAAANMQFLGKTPLSDAVRQAAAALRSTEEKATVILITDGVETCEADPCALGLELEASGVDFTAHVVGFGLTAEEGAQVACLAENTGGQYLTAGDLASLTFALQSTVVSAPPAKPEPKPATMPVIKATPKPVVVEVEYNLAPLMALSEGAAPLQTDAGQSWEVYPVTADGTPDAALKTVLYGIAKGKVPPGTYLLIGKLGSAQAEMPITLTNEATATPTLLMNASPVTLRARASAAGPVEQEATFEFALPNGTSTTIYASTTGGEIATYLPAGTIPLKVTLGATTATDTLTLTAGQTLGRDIILPSGVVVINGFYVEGLLLEGGSQFVAVESKAKGLTGTREGFGTTYGQDAVFTLPPGEYVAVFELDQQKYEQPFAVELGKRVEVPVILNAGVLAITAPGASYIEVQGSTADASGNRPVLNGTYAEAYQLTLPAGDYIVVASRDETRIEAVATVTAAARSEIDVPVP